MTYIITCNQNNLVKNYKTKRLIKQPKFNTVKITTNSEVDKKID